MAKRKQPRLKRLVKSTRQLHKKITKHKRFSVLYLAGSLVVLGVTTLYWSIIGAVIQSSNADQLSNAFLFDSQSSLSGALFPVQHTFLLKMPIFWLIGIFNDEPIVFAVFTVLLSLATVGGLALILSRIEKRPLILGGIYMALSAVLLYIPAQSYPGSLLPANFAMLTTRNIEYILFIGGIILALKAKRLVTLKSIGAMIVFILLFTSDKLFISLTVGTAAISGIGFVLARRRELARLSLRLCIIGIAAYISTLVTLFVLQRLGLHFDNGGSLGPYGLVQGFKNFAIAVIYAGAGILTNLGANPAFATLSAKDLPAGVFQGIVSIVGPGYIVTLGIALFILRGSVISTRQLLKKPLTRRKITVEWQTVLPVFLLAATLTAFITYILSNHYYPVDARYEAIALFAGFISLSAYYRKRRLKVVRVTTAGLLCLIGIIFGIVFQLQNLSAQNNALREIDSRNATVAAALKAHPVSTLLGNYWRVMPIKLGSPTISVTPLSSCTTERKVLSSTAWQPDLHKTSFAYILRLDGGLAGFPTCSLQQITDAYGRPDSSIVIAGTRTDPKELLLFYDEGIHFLQTPAANNTPVDTVKPISVDTMPFTTCPNKTIMQFVAHEDDDILFMNPDLTHDIKAGNCIRTVFFTAGDAGSNQLYWLGRQHGAEAAYNTILGTPGLVWTERVVSLDATHTATIANPRGNHDISLIFLHLPDGNPDGSGFASEHNESLRKLYTRIIPAIHPVDGSGENYTFGDLTSSLTHLMSVYKPSELRSQSTYSGTTIKDHSDHNAVGEFTTLAYTAYKQADPSAAITYYLGYPVHTSPPNVTGNDYTQKVATFLTFGQYDSGTCHSLAECNTNAVYGLYLARQYTYPY